MSYDRILCVADEQEDIEKFDLAGLVKSLKKQFGARGLDFKLRRRGVVNGAADVIVQYKKLGSTTSSTNTEIQKSVELWLKQYATSKDDIRVNHDL